MSLFVLGVLLGCRQSPEPVCELDSSALGDPEVQRALANFEAWSGELGCLGPDFVLVEDEPYLEAFSEACRDLDRRSAFAALHPIAFTGDSVAGETESARRREDFARACRTVPSQEPWKALALEELCGQFPSERGAALRTLFAGNELPRRELDPPMVLGRIEILEESVGSVDTYASGPELLVGTYLARVDVDGTSELVRRVRGYALPSLTPLWAEDLPDTTFGVRVNGGLGDVLIHNEEEARVWLATMEGLTELEAPEFSVGNVTFAEDELGWWAYGHDDTPSPEMVRSLLHGPPESQALPIGSVAFWTARSDPAGVWVGTYEGFAMQHRTGRRVSSPSWATSSESTVRAGTAEISGNLRYARPIDGEWAIEGARCEARERREVHSPLRLHFDTTVENNHIVHTFGWVRE